MKHLSQNLNLPISEGVEFILKKFNLWDEFVEKWYVKENSYWNHNNKSDWGKVLLLNEFLNEHKSLKHITKYGKFNIITGNRRVIFKIDCANDKNLKKIKLDFLNLKEGLDLADEDINVDN